MIAIVILGIGLVMVASLFPVGIQQTQEAVEISLAPSVADHAIAVLKTNLKTWTDYDKHHATPVGQIDIIEVTTGPVPSFPGAFTQAQVERPLSVANPNQREEALEQSDWPNDPWTSGTGVNETQYPGFFPIPCDNFLRLPDANIPTDTLAGYLGSVPALVVTENRSFNAPNVGTIADRDQEHARLAAVIIEANVAATEGTAAPQNPPLPEFIRTKITAFDRVFPPVSYARNNGVNALAIGPTYDAPAERKFMDDSARRRYAWKAFARRVNTPQDIDGTTGIPASVGQRVFEVVIVVLKRTQPNLRFPAQAYNPGATYPAPDAASYAFSGADLANFTNPATAPANLDTLFPQPWLIAFDILHPVLGSAGAANYAAGQFFCINPAPGTTPGIAQLLPPGSVFIDFATGTPHRVISRTFGPNPAIDDIVQIAPEPDSAAWTIQGTLNNPGPRPQYGAEFAWIFPPAYDPLTNLFTEESPVVDVFGPITIVVN